jgi:hypothetical protein
MQSNLTPYKDSKMIQELSRLQVEKALAYLASPVYSPPPEELPKLSQVEWFLLSRMLQHLLEEKDNHVLQ